MMTVLSLVAKNGEPRFSQAQQVNYWFWERGYDVVPFDREELLAGKLDRFLFDERENSIVYGAVAVVRDALDRAGRPQRPNIDFPVTLEAFLGRSVFESRMGEIRDLQRSQSNKLPLHVKPRDRQKLFKGMVIRSFSDLIALSGIPDDEPVIAQETVAFESEWRATILRHRIVNVSNYKGDAMTFPDPLVLRAALDAYSDQPIGFGMDWGITDDGRTLLVEVNDGFALGNYGVRGYQYTAMIECRWRQLMGLPDNGVGWEP